MAVVVNYVFLVAIIYASFLINKVSFVTSNGIEESLESCKNVTELFIKQGLWVESRNNKISYLKLGTRKSCLLNFDTFMRRCGNLSRTTNGK